MLTVKIIAYLVTVIASVLLVTFQKQTDGFLAKMLTIVIFFMNIGGCVILLKHHYFFPLHYVAVSLVTALCGFLLFGKIRGNRAKTAKFIVLFIVASGIIFLSI